MDRQVVLPRHRAGQCCDRSQFGPDLAYQIETIAQLGMMESGNFGMNRRIVSPFSAKVGG
jgi:hypothetical protein